MQISAHNLLASQQASQQAAPVQPKPAPGFAAALEKNASFQPLTLKQTAAPQEALTNTPPPAVIGSQRPGSTIDIKV
ncbi:MAG TPA: hypothetical protein VGP01_00615 [Rhizomicrobium sp.]|jgi:hypothetical protein|nr:hypothetical protein [Rhizomicrobium sp.]